MRKTAITYRVLAPLALVSAITAVHVSASAAASPQWYECAKAATTFGGARTGHYDDKRCSQTNAVGEGRYELGVPAASTGFRGKGGTAILHDVIPGKGDIKVECGQARDTGTIVPPNELAVSLEYSKCKSLGAPCSTAGEPTETITSSHLRGALGYLNKAHTAVGVRLTIEPPGEPYVFEFACQGLAKFRTRGPAIAALGSLGTVVKERSLVFSVGPYLGEIAAGYTPLINVPGFEEANSESFLRTEWNGPETSWSWQPEGGLPAGTEVTLNNKGAWIEDA